MNNPRPVMSMRKTVQLMVILTLLAWATQTLFAQWGYGGLILPEPAQPSPYAPPPAPAPAAAAAPDVAPPAAIKPPPAFSGATVELRSSADFKGDERVTLRDLCRWSDRDAPVMQPLAGTLIANLGGPVKVRQISVDDIKSRLHDAGANLSQLHFTGAATCSLLVEGATESEAPAETPVALATVAPPAKTAAPVIETADPFANATAPAIVAEAPATQPAPQEPQPLFEEQLVLTRPLSRGQRIIASDIRVQRVQVDEPATEPTLTREQIIGTLAARDLKAGEVFDAGDIKHPPVVTAGQFMTVAMTIGGFDIETVARAMDTAATGETVRAKNEANGDVYRVVVTGPNEGRVAPERSDNVAALPNH